MSQSSHFIKKERGLRDLRFAVQVFAGVEVVPLVITRLKRSFDI